jgi:hypothetical protein
MLLARLVVAVTVAGVVAAGASGATGDPIERHTAADMAKARAILITRSDLGAGWARDPSPSPDEDCKAFSPDESSLVETGEADALFERATSAVGSDVVIYRTEAMARHSWTIGAKLPLVDCFVEGLRTELPPNVRLTVLRRAKVRFEQVAPRTAAFYLAVRTTGPNGSFVIHLDVVALGRGRAIAALATIGLDSRAPVTERLRLARLIARRMG